MDLFGAELTLKFNQEEGGTDPKAVVPSASSVAAVAARAMHMPYTQLIEREFKVPNVCVLSLWLEKHAEHHSFVRVLCALLDVTGSIGGALSAAVAPGAAVLRADSAGYRRRELCAQRHSAAHLQTPLACAHARRLLEHQQETQTRFVCCGVVLCCVARFFVNNECAHSLRFVYG
jgi:hypothetical protein